MNHKKSVITLLSLLALAGFSYGQHTFSICAVDTATGEVGSAGASCIDGSVIISDLHPGVGVIHTQAAYIPPNQNAARALMNAGLTPKEIIDSMVANDYIFNPEIRQYGAAGIYNGSAQAHAFTGNDCMDYKNHIIGGYYAIQGNILSGQAILDSMEARFLQAEGSLACRLMEAMQGANVVGADSRCAASGNSSLSSFLRVAMPGDNPDSPYINIIIDTVPQGSEPIDSLQKRFDLLQNCQPDTSTSSHHAAAITGATLSISYHPASRKFVISGELPTSAWLELFDSMGKRVEFIQITGREVNTKRLPKGNYIARISDGTRELHHKKVIIAD